MKALNITLGLFIALFLTSNALAHCNKSKKCVYYPVAYQTCSCHGTWGSPSCNCTGPDPFLSQSASCGACRSSGHAVPGHWNGDEYQAFFDQPSGYYPTPYTYQNGIAYTVN